MPYDIMTCVCGRRFRPGELYQVRCRQCIIDFMTTDPRDKPAEPAQPVFILQPPAPLQRDPLRVVQWPTERGICAYSQCRQPFNGYTNQRYCCPDHRFKALEERRIARQSQAS
jgi:hypothetical protein